MQAKSSRRSGAGQRGTSLLEVLAAMSVMLIGASGVLALNKMGLRLDGDARRITRATAIAEDLAQHIATWPYGDPRLTNVNTANDDTLGDPTFALEDPANDVMEYVDHGEADLTLGGGWTGIPQADLEASGGYERYWGVSFNDPALPGALLDYNGNGNPDGMRVAVLVRYRTDTGWRRVVAYVFKISDRDDR